MSEILIERGVVQMLYRWLPGAIADFDSGRVIAQVSMWDSRPLPQVNAVRLLRRIEVEIATFYNVKGISERLSLEDYQILKPKNAEVKVMPLIYVCRSCRKAYNFKSVENARNNLNLNFTCKCGSRIKQIDLIFACRCGWSGPVAPTPCETHKFEDIRYREGNYKSRAWICHKDGKAKQIVKTCPDCKTRLFPSPIRQLDVFLPQMVTMIDLIQSTEERFLEDPRTPKLINATWLGLLDKADLRRLIERGIENPQIDDIVTAEIEAKIESLMDSLDIDRATAEAAVYKMMKTDDPSAKITKVIDSYDKIMHDTDKANYDNAVQILEYQTVLASPQISTIDDAKKRAKLLCSSADPDAFSSVATSFGFKEIYACSGVPIVFCTYGYTRRSSDPGKAVLRGFTSDLERELKGTGKRPIYAASIETEGILFELDRKRVVEWLLKNKIIDPVANNLPKDLNDDQLLKAWFMRNVSTSVSRYNEIDAEDLITKRVYSLLHSMSHLLLKKAAELCGLEKDSMTEYIFPIVPGFLIYCHNAQGTSLGAMFNLFEAFLDKWLYNALDAAGNCLYDPICIDEKGACMGCLYINEISCQHFNKDLDRAHLVGRVSETERLWGYWEGI